MKLYIAYARETIKKMIHKSGSQIFSKGGFIVKLPQNTKYK